MFAGKQVAKLNFGAAAAAVKDAFSTEVISGTYQRGNLKASPEVWEFIRASKGLHFTYSGAESCVNAYKLCPPVAAIINRKAVADANGEFSITKVKGKGKDSEATSVEAVKLRNLMQSPNPLQSGVEFWMMVKIYTQLCGHCLILPTGGALGFSPLDAKYWWVVPPNLYTIDETASIDFSTGKSIQRIRILNGDKTITLPPSEVLLLKDISPSFSNPAIGASRLESVQDAINNIIGAYESRNVLMNQRGPTMIISSDKKEADAGTISLNPSEKEEIQDAFAAKYGIRRGQSQAIITNASIKLETVGFATKDLLLHEEVKESTNAICEAYSFPSDLLAREKGATFSNGYNADKTLYQNAIIPEANLLCSQLSSWLKLSTYGLELCKEFDHVAALQENKKEQAEARKTLTESLDLAYKSDVITLGRYRELLGEDAGQNANTYYSQTLQNGNGDQNQQGQATNASGNQSGNS